MSVTCEIEQSSAEANQIDFADEARVRPARKNSAGRGLGVAALASAMLLLGVLAWPMFREHVYVADDLGAFHLPMRAFYGRQLAAGEPFDWCPQLFGGFYLTGEGQVGSYHPLHLIWYRCLPLSIAFDLECWLSYPVMLAGMYVLFRRWRLRWEAALAGATFFTFGGFNLLHFVHPNAIAVVAHLPWQLVLIDCMARGPAGRARRLAVAGVALLTGSQLLSGYPQYVLFSLIAEGAYLAAIVLLERPRHRILLPFLGWLSAISIGALVGGVQLLPTFDALADSVRKSAGESLTAQGSLHPLNVVQLVAPYLFDSRVVGDNTHEFGLYLGAVPLVLAIWWLMQGKSKSNRPLTMFALAIVAVGFLWAFGEFGPLGWVQAHLPLLNRFRFACRSIVLVQFGIAILAALGLAAIAADSGRRTIVNMLWLLPIASAAISVLAVALWPEHVAAWPMIIAAPLLLAIAVWLVERAANGSQWAIAALMLFAAADMGIYGMSYSIFGKTDSLVTFVKLVSTPEAPPGTRVALETDRVPSHLRIGNQILLTGFKRIDGYAGLEPQRRLDYRERAALRAAGVQFVADPQNGSPERDDWRLIDDPCPRAWLVSKARLTDQPQRDISQIQLTEEALVEEPFAEDVRLGIPATPPKVTVQLDRPGRIAIATDSSADQLLIVNESYHTGWCGAIDGANAKVLRVDGDFVGMVVPAGQHQITLDFQPKSLFFGRLGSCFGLGFIGAVVLIGWRKHAPASTKTCSAQQAA
jgi:hypothetical protein